MGQCAPSSSPDFWANSIDDDDITFVITLPNDLVRKQDSPTFTHQQQRYFLQTHHPDSSQRCLVDHDEIKRAIWLQSDELLLRTGNLKMHGFDGKDKKGQKVNRYQRMPVLRLKMKANVGWFYTNHYLKMFPSESKANVRPMTRKEEWIPELACESSDSSFASSCSSRSNDGGDLGRSTILPPITKIKCPMTNESLFDLAIMGCLGLISREQDHNALTSSRRQLRDHCQTSQNHCLVLINQTSGAPLATCILDETPAGSQVIRIYTTKKMAFAQKKVTTTKNIGLPWFDETDLYTWAEIRTEGDFPCINFAIFLVHHFHGCISPQPSYRASFEEPFSCYKNNARSPVMKIVGRTDSESQMTGCAFVWMQNDVMTTQVASAKSSSTSFHISVAEGIDPALLICFAAVADEILENSMRMRCKKQTRRFERSDSFALTKQRLEARSNFHSADKLPTFNCAQDINPYSRC